MTAITERARRDLYEHAEGTWGKETADTLMAHLPPVGWADVATKSDLALLKSEVGLVRSDLATTAELFRKDLIIVEERLTAQLHKELSHQTRVFFAMTLTAVIAVSGLPHVLGRIL